MMVAAEANHATMQRLLALDIALLRANTVAQAVQALYRSLEQDFGLQQYRLVFGGSASEQGQNSAGTVRG